MRTEAPTLPHRWRPESYKQERSTEHGQVFYTETPVPYAIAYKGKAQKRTWHYRFQSVERMHERIREFFDGLASSAKARKARRAERQSLDARLHFMLGDIVYNMWGYDQTNVDFYQVVAVTPRTLMLRRVHATVKETGFMSGQTEPIRDSFREDCEPERHFVTGGCQGKPSVCFQYGSGSKWDGKAMFSSWYA